MSLKESVSRIIWWEVFWNVLVGLIYVMLALETLFTTGLPE